MAYNLYGWKVLLGTIFVFASAGFFTWVGFSIKHPAAWGSWNERITVADMAETDATIFQAEMLYAAAHHYAADHDGKLPNSAGWQTALAPYLARAGASNAALANKHRFVMNRALSDDTLRDTPDPAHTLLFWEADTTKNDLPPSAYWNASGPFLGVTCDGTPVYAVPSGKPDTLPFMRRAQYSRPRK